MGVLLLSSQILLFSIGILNLNITPTSSYLIRAGDLIWNVSIYSSTYSSPSMADVDNDGQIEILIGTSSDGSYANSIICINSQGYIEWRYDLNGSVSGVPSIADVNNDNVLDILIADTTGIVYCIKGSDHTQQWNYTIPSKSQISSSIAIGNLDNDANIEVAFTAGDGKLYVLNGQNGNLEYNFTTGSSYLACPVIVDVDNDGRKEIIVSAGTILCFRTDSIFPIWNVSYSSSSTPAIADVDNDGILEIFLGLESNKIICLNAATGALKWSYDLIGYVHHSSPVVADVDKDGVMELIIGTYVENAIYCLNAVNGNFKWKYVTNDWIYSTPVIAEFNGDGFIDIFVSSWDKNLYVLDGRNGALMYKYQTGGQIYSNPLVGDIDEDGLLEIIFSSFDKGVYCLATNGRSTSIPGPWPMFGGDPTIKLFYMDSDNDNIPNHLEMALKTAPNIKDTDNDGNDDNVEITIYSTDPTKKDTDGDTMPDNWEIQNQLNPNYINDAFSDYDNDGLTNQNEYLRGTNPHDPDSDNDFLNDLLDPAPNNFLMPMVYGGAVLGIILVIMIISLKSKRKSK